MERQDGKNTAFLQRSFRFFYHHKTVKPVIGFLFSVKHIRIDDKIKKVIVKIMTVIFSALSGCNAADLLILRFAVYIIQALFIDIHSIHFALLLKCICRSERIITGTAAVIKDYRITAADDRRKDFRAFSLFPVVYFIENAHMFIRLFLFF